MYQAASPVDHFPDRDNRPLADVIPINFATGLDQSVGDSPDEDFKANPTANVQPVPEDTPGYASLTKMQREELKRILTDMGIRPEGDFMEQWELTHEGSQKKVDPTDLVLSGLTYVLRGLERISETVFPYRSSRSDAKNKYVRKE